MRTKKSAVYIILAGVISPLILCALGAFTKSGGDAAILAAVYVTFGLVFVLVLGWLLSLVTQHAKHPVRWLVAGYLLPVAIINAAIIALLFVAN
jgi:hypothetical protein